MFYIGNICIHGRPTCDCNITCSVIINRLLMAKKCIHVVIVIDLLLILFKFTTYNLEF